VAAARDLPADRLAEALSYAAYTCAAAGLTAEAARHAEDAAALTPRMPSLSRRLPVLANAGQTLVECGETARARARAVLDRGLAEAVESGEQLPTYAVPCGWLAVAEGDWPAATAAFGGYLAGPEATEQPVWAVEALLGAACALARTGDRPVAATVLAGATTAAMAMGVVLTPWTAARIAEARELCGPAGPAPDDLASLTALVTRRAHGVVAAATD
jgi:hypothetical protein